MGFHAGRRHDRRGEQVTHPHKELIIALLDDPTLEVEQFADHWRYCAFDSIRDAIAFIATRPDYRFRLREKPKPDVVQYLRVTPNGTSIYHSEHDSNGKHNVIAAFSADGVLKSAAVLRQQAATDEPVFAYYDPTDDVFSCDKDGFKRGHTIWPLVRK